MNVKIGCVVLRASKTPPKQWCALYSPAMHESCERSSPDPLYGGPVRLFQPLTYLLSCISEENNEILDAAHFHVLESFPKHLGQTYFYVLC